MTITAAEIRELCAVAKADGVRLQVRRTATGDCVTVEPSGPRSARTAAERMKSYRERIRVTQNVTPEPETVTTVTEGSEVTQSPSPSLPPPSSPLHSPPSPALTPTPEGGARMREEAPHKAIRWNPETGWTGITDTDRKRWSEAAPACDIDRQLSAADLWLRANPAKARKANFFRFFTNWLARAQEKGGDATSNGGKGPSSTHQHTELHF